MPYRVKETKHVEVSFIFLSGVQCLHSFHTIEVCLVNKETLSAVLLHSLTGVSNSIAEHITLLWQIIRAARRS